jgi:hypothetical protein
LLDPKGHSIHVEIKPDGYHKFSSKDPKKWKWIKGIKLTKLDEAGNNILFIWNTHYMNFYDFKTDKTGSAAENTSSICEFQDLTSKEDYITDVLLCSVLNYFVVATHFGNIKVFKWERKKDRSLPDKDLDKDESEAYSRVKEI